MAGAYGDLVQPPGPRLDFNEKSPRPVRPYANTELQVEVPLPALAQTEEEFWVTETECSPENDEEIAVGEMADSEVGGGTDTGDPVVKEEKWNHDQEGAHAGAGEAPADPGFNRLLLELAKEHRRSLLVLRTRLEARYEQLHATFLPPPKQSVDVSLHARSTPLNHLGEEVPPRPRCSSLSTGFSGTNSCTSPYKGVQHTPSSPRRICTLETQQAPLFTLDQPLHRILGYESEGLRSTVARCVNSDAPSIGLPTGTMSPLSMRSTSEVSLDGQNQSDLKLLRSSTNKEGDLSNILRPWRTMRSMRSQRGSQRGSKGSSGSTASHEKFQLSQAFDHFSGLAILMNSILLGWAANFSAQNALQGRPPDEMPKAFMVVTVIFTLWFSVELVVRICVNGLRKFFWREDWCWNIFDTMVVGSDFIHTVIELTAQDVDGGIAVQNFTVVRVLRILRITRAIRVVRLIRFFRELRMMVASVLKSGSSLVWSLLMLSITIYIFGVYFLQIVAYHIHSSGEEGQESQTAAGEPIFQNGEPLEVMFGNLLRAQYTLYLTISGGISWGEIGAKLIAIHPVHGFALSFFTFFTTFALLNIITGIFVDTSIKSAENDREEVIQEQLHKQTRALKEMKKIFQSADTQRNGSITLEQFEQHITQKEVRAHMNSIGLEVDRARNLFKLLDINMNGTISIEEFVFGCMRLKGTAKSLDVATLMYQTRRMAEQFRLYFMWSEHQFNRVHLVEKRLEQSLRGLFGDEQDMGVPDGAARRAATPPVGAGTWAQPT